MKEYIMSRVFKASAGIAQGILISRCLLQSELLQNHLWHQLLVPELLLCSVQMDL